MPLHILFWGRNGGTSLMFVDPCIIVQFIQKNPTGCNSVSKFIIPYLYDAQHVSGVTTHHQEPKTALAASGLHTWKVVGLWLLDAVRLCLQTSFKHYSQLVFF
jgi:hypothetical protein